MGYGLTSEQRRIYSQARQNTLTARAENMRSNRAYTNTATFRTAAEEKDPRSFEAQNPEIQNTPTEAQGGKDASFVERSLETVADWAGTVIGGAMKGLEGIADFGMSVVGAVGGIFDQKFKDRVKENVAYDFVQENWYDADWYKEITDSSYIYEMGETGQNILRGVGQGIGQMLPAVAITLATGGMGAPAAVAQGLSLAYLAASAAGTGTEEAYKEGADYYSGLGYGVLSGAVEAATEKIVGGGFGKVLGNGVLDGAIKNTLSKAFKSEALRTGLKVAIDVAGEGLEEVVAEALSPALKRLTYDKNASPATVQQLVEAGLIGSLTSLAFQGTVGQVNRHRTNVSESMQELDTLEQKKAKMQAKGTLTEEALKNIETMEQQTLERSSKDLSKMSEKAREKLLKNVEIARYFEPDGTLKTRKFYGMVPEGQRKSVSTNADIDIVERLSSGEFALGQDKLKIKENYTPEQESARNELFRTHNSLKIGSARVYIVDGLSEKGAYDGKGNIFISGDLLGEVNSAKELLVDKTLLHEATHYTEGSKEYGEYAHYALLGIQESSYLSVAEDYGVDKTKAKGLYEVLQKDTLSESDQKLFLDKDIRKLQSELVARYSGTMFSNEASVSRIVSSNRSFAVKVYNRLKAGVKKIQAFFGAEKGERYRAFAETSSLIKAERLFAKALSAGDQNLARKEQVSYLIGEARKDNIQHDKGGESLERIPAGKREVLHKARKKLSSISFARKSELLMKGAFSYDNQQWVVSPYMIASFIDKAGETKGTPLTFEDTSWVRNFKDFGERLSSTFSLWKNVAKEKGTPVDISLTELRAALAAASEEQRRKGYAKINDTYFLARELEALLSSVNEPKVSIFEAPTRWAGTKKGVWVEGTNGEAVIFSARGNYQGVNNVVFRISDNQFSFSRARARAIPSDSVVYEINGETTAQTVSPIVDKSEETAYNNLTENKGETNEQRSEEERIQRRTDSRGEEDTGKHGEEQGESRDTNGVSTVPLGDSTNSEPNAETDSSTAIPRYLGLSEESQKYLEEQGFTYFDFYSPTSEDFIAAMEKFRDANRHSASVEIKSKEEYDKCLLIMARDGLTGCAVAPGGDMVSAFNNCQKDERGNVISGRPKQLPLMFAQLIENGGRKGDNFNLRLSDLYSKMGAIAVARTRFNDDFAPEGWNYEQDGRPDIVFWILPTADDSVVERLKKRKEGVFSAWEAELGNVPLFDDYFQAQEFRDGIIAGGELTSERILAEVAKAMTPAEAVVAEATEQESETIVEETIEEPEVEATEQEGEALVADEAGDENAPIETRAQRRERRAGPILQGNRGRLRKVNNKSYTQKEAAAAIETIMTDILNMDGAKKDRFRRSGTFKAAWTELWTQLNTLAPEERQKGAEKLARYMVESEILSLILEKGVDIGFNITDTTALEEARQLVVILSEYKNAFNLESLTKEDLSHLTFDRNTLFKLWGHGNGDIQALAKELRARGIRITTTDAETSAQSVRRQYNKAVDALNEINKEYFNSLKALRQAVEDYISFEKEGTDSLIRKTTDELLKAYEILGKETPEARERRLSDLRSRQRLAVAEELQYRARLSTTIIDTATKIRDFAERKYTPSSILSDPTLNVIAKELGKIKFRHDLRKAQGIREIILKLNAWYTESNPVLGGEINPSLKEALEFVSERYAEIKRDEAIYAEQRDAALAAATTEKEKARAQRDYKYRTSSAAILETSELEAIAKITQGLHSLFTFHDSVNWNGKRMETQELATQLEKQLEESISNRKKVSKGKFFRNSLNPRAAIRMAENFSLDENGKAGLLTEAFEKIQQGETSAQVYELDIMRGLRDFFKEHKGFKKKAINSTVKVRGLEIPYLQALSLYLTAQRKQAQLGLFASGFEYESKDGWKEGFKLADETLDAAGRNEIISLAKAGQTALLEQQIAPFVEEIKNQLNDTDLAFVEEMKKSLEKAKAYKEKTDMLNYGYTNVVDGFYFPIVRDRQTIAKNIGDTRTYMTEVNVMNNLSFNKDVKLNAMNKISLHSAFDIIGMHAGLMGRYAGLSDPIRTFSKVYAFNTGTATDVRTARSTIEKKSWQGFEEYMKELLEDIQGIKPKKGAGGKILEKLRSSYAVSQLAANPRVVLVQFASYFASYSRLDARSLAQAFTKKINFKDMDKYCPYAEVRELDNVLVRSLGLLENVGEVGRALMKPISWNDRLTLGLLWNACQIQVEKETGYWVGTETNKEKAGVLLDNVIRNTQANFVASSRSGFSRSNNFLIRSFTMFMSEPTVFLSTLTTTFGEHTALLKRAKAGDATAQKQLAKSKKKCARAFTAVFMSNLYYTMLTLLFKKVMKREEEDEEGNAVPLWQQGLEEFAGTYVGMLPFIRDAYGYFINGFEVDGFVDGMINDLFQSSNNLIELSTAAANGEPVDETLALRSLRNSVFSLGAMSGIPTRNLYNLVRDGTKMVDESSGYRLENTFYKSSTQDLNKALKQGNTGLANTIIDLMIDERINGVSAAASEVISGLYQKGFTAALPRSVRAEVILDGEEIVLTARQRARFEKVYGEAGKHINSLVRHAQFKSLSDEEKAKAIKFIYDRYYEYATYDLFGEDADNKLMLLSKAVPLADLSIILPNCVKITGDKKKQLTAAYLKNYNGISQAQKLLILAHLGYRDQTIEKHIRAAIALSKDLNTEEKGTLFSFYKSA